MDKIRITSFWLVLSLATCAPLPAQEQRGTTATPDSALASVEVMAAAAANWLPGLTPEELADQSNNGLRALRARQWVKAALHFELVLQFDPSQREVQKRLDQARKSVERQSPASRIEDYYAEGAAAMARSDWRLALLAFQKVTEQEPAYRDTRQQQQRAVQNLRQQLMAAHFSRVSPLLLDSLLVGATQAMTQAQWWRAIVLLEKIRVLKPGYAQVEELLARAYPHVQAPPSQNTAAAFPINKNFVTITALFLCLSCFGYFFVSPAGRGRIYLMQGKFALAASHYEKHLGKNPKHLGYYAKLAQIYLQLGRRDQAALKIFQIVLQLNLLNPSSREAINNIVAQYYLAEGRQDKDAIEVLEEALAYELHKQSHGMALVKAAPNGLVSKKAR